jgi:mono/diheme cytochrome c family protein
MPATTRAAALLIGASAALAAAAAFAQTGALKTAESFDSIADKSERSRAIFVEAGKVIQSPRCLNCHPGGDRPTQGNDMHLHVPMVVRGPADKGATALRCATCHQAANFEPAGMPGHPLWHVAPLSMAWQGKSLKQICEQIKDRTRNGNKTLPQIHEHMAADTLVGWAWSPGSDRVPAPGTQAEFGKLIEAWMRNGAACPAS